MPTTVAIPTTVITARCHGTGASTQLTTVSTSGVSGPCSALGPPKNGSMKPRPSASTTASALYHSESLSSSGVSHLTASWAARDRDRRDDPGDHERQLAPARPGPLERLHGGRR